MSYLDELGTSLARSAAYRAFAALAFAGIAVGVMFLAGGRYQGVVRYREIGTQFTSSWLTVGLLVSALAAQVALASGVLALLRAWRLRRQTVIPAGDAVVIRRRAAIGLVAGCVTLLALPLVAGEAPHAFGAAWHEAALLVAGASLLALAAALPGVLASHRLQPTGRGPVGDLTADLRPLLRDWVPTSPLTCALLLAGAIFMVLTAFGVIAGDPYDGALRGIADGAACLAGYAALGRYLGLRATRT